VEQFKTFIMAILGVGMIIPETMEPDSVGYFKAEVKVVTNDGSSHGSFIATGLEVSGLTELLLQSSLKTAIKNYMINSLGFSFGLLDTVKVVGASVI
jgi:hypothetical protein